jgi:hypothetical protein
MRLQLFSIAFALTMLAGGAYAQPPEGRGRPDGDAPEGRGDRPREGRDGPREGRDGRDGPSREGREGRPEGPAFRFPPLPLMVALDADANGEISAEEIEGAAAALKKLDKNSDGVLTREELRPDFGGREGGFRGREGGREGGPDGPRRGFGRRPRPEGDERGEDARPEGRRPRPEGEGDDAPRRRRPEA